MQHAVLPPNLHSCVAREVGMPRSVKDTFGLLPQYRLPFPWLFYGICSRARSLCRCVALPHALNDSINPRTLFAAPLPGRILYANADPDDNGIAEDTTKLNKMQMALALRDASMEKNDTLGAYTSMRDLAQSFSSLGDFSVARQFCLTALHAAKENGTPEIVAEAHEALGVVYDEQGLLDEAVAEMYSMKELLTATDPVPASIQLARMMIKQADHVRDTRHTTHSACLYL